MGDDAKDFLVRMVFVAFWVIFLGGLGALAGLFVVFLSREMRF